jgi:ketosteroid isomerase-like protein
MTQGDCPTNNESLPEHLFRQLMECWAAQDLDGMFDYIHPNAVHQVNLDGAILPKLATADGSDAMRARFTYLFDLCEVVRFEIDALRTDGTEIISSIGYHYRHRVTGQNLVSWMRLIATWRDGRFIQFDEYADEASVEAFMRLIREI